MRVQLEKCKQNDILPLALKVKNMDSAGPSLASHMSHENVTLPVGTTLLYNNEEFFKVVGRILQPFDDAHARHCPLLSALTDIDEQEIELNAKREGYALAWITLSDKGAAGLREDLSGPSIGQILRDNLPLCHEQGFILPDDALALRALVLELALGQGYDIICTTGGTGLTKRDVTPEAMQAILDCRLHGFEQAMMQASLEKTPNAMLSRAMVGTIKREKDACLCINLPGSVKAVQENLAAILPALPHALKKLHGDNSNCAR